MPAPYDALLIVSFGGPERREDVIPFLENVLRGKPVPRERMLEVAEHYYHFGGVSPINAQVREFIAELSDELRSAGVELPIYWGNRNWHPLLPDTLQQMARDGVKNSLAFMTSAYSSYSGCRQYRENIEAARTAVGEQSPIVDKIRVFYNHPEFIAANLERIQAAVESLPEVARGEYHVAYTAHSIPMSMADNCQYVKQLSETVRLLNEQLGLPPERGRLVYQSRSGRPQDPWLEPDILDHLSSLAEQEIPGVVVAPIGFLSDHMEVLFDLDEEAQQLCQQKGVPMARAATVGTHARFIRMVRELVQERMGMTAERRAIGEFGPNHDVCPANCCQYNAGRPPAAVGAAGGRPS